MGARSRRLEEWIRIMRHPRRYIHTGCELLGWVCCDIQMVTYSLVDHICDQIHSGSKKHCQLDATPTIISARGDITRSGRERERATPSSPVRDRNPAQECIDRTEEGSVARKLTVAVQLTMNDFDTWQQRERGTPPPVPNSADASHAC